MWIKETGKYKLIHKSQYRNSNQNEPANSINNKHTGVVVLIHIIYICVITIIKRDTMPDFDFGFDRGNSKGNDNPAPADNKTDLDTGNVGKDGITGLDNTPVAPDNNPDPTTPTSGNDPKPEPKPEPKPNNKPESKPDVKKDDKNNGQNGDGTIDVKTLEAGTTLETTDGVFTVDNEGNLVDKDGNIFKKADEANDYINQFVAEEGNEDEISIDAIQKSIGIDVVDDKGKKVKFDNTPQGIKSYIDSVIEIRESEIQEATLNRLYSDIPILPDLINYYVANGNSLEGFNEVPDRSQIVVDENDTAQQKAIIKQAYKEFGKRGDVNKYIKYLEDSGQLVEVAKEELAALQKADEEAHERLRQEAEAKIKADEEESEKYWLGVKKVIDSKKIAGYQIPDNIIIERDGKKISATPNDFFNYVYQIDENGISRYQYDLAKDTPEQRRDDQLLRAYLRFVGGNYASLVDMAIKEEKAKTLKLKSKQATTKGVKINPPQSNNKPKDIDFGY